MAAERPHCPLYKQEYAHCTRNYNLIEDSKGMMADTVIDQQSFGNTHQQFGNPVHGGGTRFLCSSFCDRAIP